jgi:hypothetical protein
MVSQGVECIDNIRRRYDGERRNPWDEAECGHHYARAMAAWSAIPALSGFRYHGGEKSVSATPRIQTDKFSSFWSTATGWGTFSQSIQGARTRFSILANEGTLFMSSLALYRAPVGQSSAKVGNRTVQHTLKPIRNGAVFTFAEEIVVKPGDELEVIL